MQSDVNWSAYAKAYDIMADNNPAYQELLNIFIKHAEGWSFSESDTIADIGAGTGNFSIQCAALFPLATVLHIEPDSIMNSRAVKKMKERKIENIIIIKEYADSADLTFNNLSAAVCVHSLYSFPSPQSIIKKIFSWLRPGGILFACDLGRVLDVRDWRRYMFNEMKKRIGLIRTIHRFIKGSVVSYQNRRITQMQLSGKLWLHDLTEYQHTFKTNGFNIVTAETCYRGYSDLVVCKKP